MQVVVALVELWRLALVELQRLARVVNVVVKVGCLAAQPRSLSNSGELHLVVMLHDFWKRSAFARSPYTGEDSAAVHVASRTFHDPL